MNKDEVEEMRKLYYLPAYLLFYLFSPLFYSLSTRREGKSWKDFWQFLKGK